MVEVMEDTDFQMAAVEHQRQLVLGFDQGLPADAGKVEGNLGGEQGPRGVLIALNPTTLTLSIFSAKIESVISASI